MKKFLSYILILIALVGFLGVAGKASAQGTEPTGTCVIPAEGEGPPQSITATETDCDQKGGTWTPGTGTGTQGGSEDEKISEFERVINENKCSLNPLSSGSFWPGCFIQAAYGLFYVIPAFVLGVVAYFFNVLISVTLYPGLLKHDFVSQAWGVVRDLSNIFFILILLYVAIKIILNLGEHEAKGMIVKVLIIALLINFSMFFTKVVIDASNILALIFYNKLKVNTTVNGAPRPYSPASKNGTDKDVSGGMVGAFDPTKLLTKDFFKKAKIDTIYTGDGQKVEVKNEKVPYGKVIGITLIAGTIMIVASYALFVAGFAFLSRLIELFVLIIFSPFAFMSFAVPKFATMEYMGWNDWFKRLIKVSFMAPIFMFFMYFIFLLIHSKIYDELVSKSSTGFIESVLAIFIPAVLILILLLKATEFAKKGSGTLGEMASGAAKAVGGMVGGLALGAATGGAALLGTKAIGGLASKVAGSERLKTAANEENRGLSGWLARKALKTGDYGQKASFDVRQTGAGKWLQKKNGVDWQRSSVIGLGSKKGGFKGAAERHTEALKEESTLYKTTKTDKQVQDWSQERQDEYDTKREKIMRKNPTMTPEEYERRYGPRPDSYRSADELNKARMVAFQNNFGKSDLIGALAKTLTAPVDDRKKIKDKDGKEKDNGSYYKRSPEYRKWANDREKAYQQALKENGGALNHDQLERFDRMYRRDNPEPTPQSINDDRAKTNKMVIGGAIGGLAGGVGIGAPILGYAAGVAAATHAASDKAGEKKFTAETTKHYEKVGKLADKMQSNTDAITRLTDLIKKGNELVKDEDGKSVELVGKDGKVNTEEVERQLARIASIEEVNKFELRRLREAGKKDNDPEVMALRRTTMDNSVTTLKLNQMKTAERDIRNYQKENIDLGNQRSEADKAQAPKPQEGKEEKGHGGETKATPAAKTEPSHPQTGGDHGPKH